MYGLRGSRAREKTALMPDPFRRSSLKIWGSEGVRLWHSGLASYGYGHGAPEEGPVGTLPSRRALGSLG